MRGGNRRWRDSARCVAHVAAEGRSLHGGRALRRRRRWCRTHTRRTPQSRRGCHARHGRQQGTITSYLSIYYSFVLSLFVPCFLRLLFTPIYVIVRSEMVGGIKCLSKVRFVLGLPLSNCRFVMHLILYRFVLVGLYWLRQGAPKTSNNNHSHYLRPYLYSIWFFVLCEERRI